MKPIHAIMGPFILYQTKKKKTLLNAKLYTFNYVMPPHCNPMSKNLDMPIEGRMPTCSEM